MLYALKKKTLASLQYSIVGFLQKYFCIRSWNNLTTFYDNSLLNIFDIFKSIKKHISTIQTEKVKVFVILWKTWI